jgi:hypothetical protein
MKSPCLEFFTTGKCECENASEFEHCLSRLPSSYKNTPCKNKVCEYKENCTFAHSLEEIMFWNEKMKNVKRALCRYSTTCKRMFCPFFHKNRLFCPHFLENPCPLKEACSFPHENENVPFTFKLQLCKKFLDGNCSFEEDCLNAHSIEEREYGRKRCLNLRNETCTDFDEKEFCALKYNCPRIHVRWAERCWNDMKKETCTVPFCVYFHTSQTERKERLSKEAESKHYAAMMRRTFDEMKKIVL